MNIDTVMVVKGEMVARTAFCRDWVQLAHTAQVVEILRGEGGSDLELTVGWLHDVLEDTPVTATDLADMRFPSVVIGAVELLTRETGSLYSVYKQTLLAAPGDEGRIARVVKLADARHNLFRCEQAAGVPKWEKLAGERYRPMIRDLEALL